MGLNGSSNPAAVQGITIIPNPTTALIRIYSDTPELSIIYSATGRAVGFLSPNQVDQTVDISDLPAGIYFLQVGLGGRMTKIIKM